MKRNKAVGLFLMIIIIFQALYFLNDESLHLYSFAVGINRESKDAMDIITMAVFLVPVFFMHFYFSETLYNLTHGYGKLYIIRQYSKTKLIIKQIVKIFLSVLVITAFQIITSFIFSASLKSVQAGNMIRCVSIYIICIFTMQMLQMMLEYFLKPEQAAIICCAYALVSCRQYYCTSIILSLSDVWRSERCINKRNILHKIICSFIINMFMPYRR